MAKELTLQTLYDNYYNAPNYGGRKISRRKFNREMKSLGYSNKSFGQNGGEEFEKALYDANNILYPGSYPTTTQTTTPATVETKVTTPIQKPMSYRMVSTYFPQINQGTINLNSTNPYQFLTTNPQFSYDINSPQFSFTKWQQNQHYQPVVTQDTTSQEVSTKPNIIYNNYWQNIAKNSGIIDLDNMDKVADFQAKHGLTVDGKLGQQTISTWNKLNPTNQIVSPKPTENPVNTNPPIKEQETSDNENQGWTDFWDRLGIRPWLKKLLGIKKQGGKMTYKFQQGGQASSQDAVMQFVQALAQTLQADPNQVIQAAQQNPEALKSAVQVYQQTQDIQQAAQAFSQALQSQAQVAKHGAKLNYLKALKNQCADDEELVYFKKGGKVDCGCRKKEDGGEMKKESPISKFKKVKKADDGVKLLSNKQLNDSISKYNKPYSKGMSYEDKVKQEEKLEKFQKEAERRKNSNKSIKKDCGGSKMKLKKGDKVCPKCGKVHAAGMGCAVAKFKYRKLGGQL